MTRAARSGSATARVFAGGQGTRGRALPLRLGLFNHSPDGFQWGYGGSGPAQLALAILCDYFRATLTAPAGDPFPIAWVNGEADRLAVALHQDFKWAVLANEQRDAWELTSDQVRELLERLAASQPESAL